MRPVWLLLSLTLAGCAQLDAPSPPPAAHQPLATAHRPAPAIAPPSWQAWPDAQLQRLLQQAEAQGLDGAEAAARLRQARAAWAAATADGRPQLSLQPQWERQQSPRRPPGSSEPQEGRLSFSRIGLDAVASWEPDFYGRQKLAREATRAQWQAAELDLAGTRAAVRAALLQAYLNLAQAEAQARLLKTQAELAEAQQQSRAMRLRAGLDTQADGDGAQLAQQALAQALRDAGHERQLALQQLALLTGQEPAALALQPVEARLLDLPAQPPSADATELLARRPDVQAAWQRGLAATGDSERARLERFPRLGFSLSGGWSADSLRRFLRDDSSVWLLGLRASVPLLDGGRIRAAAGQAQAAADAQGQAYRRQVLEALQQVASSWTQLEQLDEHLQLAQDEAHQAQRELARRQKAEQVGRLSLRELRDAQSQWLGRQLQERALRAERLRASVRLQQAVGALS